MISPVERTWRTAMAVPGIDHVAVVTDDDRIAAAAHGFGAHVVMTPDTCRNGTERCAAALDQVAQTLGVSRRTVINWLQEFAERSRKYVTRDGGTP